MECKISVIVPVYNVEKYLDKCLESIVTQSLKDIEIIIVNDCSPDNSLEIIKKYMEVDKRIILVDKVKNEGLTSARNSGLEISQGEYILHIDSDDWIEQDYLKDMYDTAIKYDADMVISNYYRDYGNGKKIYIIDQYGITGTILDKRRVIENLAIIQEIGYPCIWNKLIKKEIYSKNNVTFPLGISIGEDLGTTIFLMYFSRKIVKLDKAYIHYMQNSNGMTKNPKYSSLTDIYFVLSKIEKFFLNKNFNIFLKKLKYNHLSNCIYNVKSNFKDKLYNKILNEYLFLLEERKNNKNNEKYVKGYFILRKIFDPKISFKIIKNLLNIKKYIITLLRK